ncbi:MAG: potassium channel protein [Dehalococcoidales bacterium]|nr:potassium channel protein [Dehalococcoidales bacterium]
MYRKLFWAGATLLFVFLIGTVGYWLISGGQTSLLDALYMTFITVATIGYAEIIDLSASPGGRVFTMLIAVAGIGVLAYAATNITALLVEGQLTQSFRRIRMERTASRLKDHYIICGIGAVGLHIASELQAVKQPVVIVDISEEISAKNMKLIKDGIFIEGDATEVDTLLKAGIKHARGLFAVSGDDNQNLIITLTAKQVNPQVRVVVRCDDTANSGKMEKVGADAVVSPTMIGGLRMASVMIRPTVVSFLDIMLRDKDKNLRVEEVAIPARFTGKTISSLDLKRFPNLLLLAVQTAHGWVFNPTEDSLIGESDNLIVMTTPEEKLNLSQEFEKH